MFDLCRKRLNVYLERFIIFLLVDKEESMNQEAQEYYNIAGWVKDKINYNRISKFNSNKRRQVLHGQIWYCDLGYNIGTEKTRCARYW